MAGLSPLEAIATELMQIFEINAPPVPIEIMLQRPKPDMWDEADLNELSVGFLISPGPYSLRMSFARWLARLVFQCEWGEKRGMREYLKGPKSEQNVHAFARMLIMPIEMVRTLTPSAQLPITMSMHFEVPEEDAKQRLDELIGFI